MNGIHSGGWRGRRVFVTGHTGFIGSWLLHTLLRAGAVVTGFSLPPPTRPSLFDDSGVGARTTDLRGDIRDAEALSAALIAAEPEIVLHLAAQALVLHAKADPLDSFTTNVIGTANLLEAVRRCPAARAVVLMTTDKVYRNDDNPRPFRETDVLGGREPYGGSKACSEIAIEVWRHSYLAENGVGVAAIRAGNVIGGGDWAANRLIPDAVRSFLTGQPLVLRHPNSIRPWQHVLEVVDFVMRVGQALLEGHKWAADAWNVGPTDADIRPVHWVADHLAAAWGNGASWRSEASAGPYEAKFLSLDCTHARLAFGWQPRWDLATAIAFTVAAYRAGSLGADPTETINAQIGEFFDG